MAPDKGEALDKSALELAITAGVVGAIMAVMLKEGREAYAFPSLTLIMTPLVVPMSALLGVPVSAPVLVLKLAQTGWLVMLNVRVSPSASLAVGVKL